MSVERALHLVKNKVTQAGPRYRDMRVLYVGSPPLFSGGASPIHMMKMYQAMTLLGISVECVLPDGFPGTNCSATTE